jgi:hypothetical protein
MMMKRLLMVELCVLVNANQSLHHSRTNNINSAPFKWGLFKRFLNHTYSLGHVEYYLDFLIGTGGHTLLIIFK